MRMVANNVVMIADERFCIRNKKAYKKPEIMPIHADERSVVSVIICTVS